MSADNDNVVDYIATNFLTQQDIVQLDDVETAFEKLHVKFPFLEVNPIVSSRNQVYMASANDNEDLVIPSSALLMRLKGSKDFLAGNIDVTRVTSNIQDGTAPMVNPDGWYYCQGKSSISIMTLDDNCLVTAEFYLG